jgi:hypothetical protein
MEVEAGRQQVSAEGSQATNHSDKQGMTGNLGRPAGVAGSGSVLWDQVTKGQMGLLCYLLLYLLVCPVLSD